MRELSEIKAIVSVDGERTAFLSLKISQRMSEHHHFELVIDHRTFDEKFFEAPEKKLALVNKKVVIDLQPGDNIGKAYVFSGLIDSVRILNEAGMHGSILLSGKSNTVELERGRICQTYSKTNLYTIVKEVTADTNNLSIINTPDWKSDIAFAIQFKETDWDFLSRILHQYHVGYHYNGLDLIVGPYPEYPVVNLTYDLELRSLEVCSRLLANDETNYFYRREDHSTISQDSPKEVDGANYYLDQVSKQSDRLTRRRKPNAPVEAYVADMDGLINQMTRKKVSTGAEMMYIKGTVKTVDVLIGRLINIQFPKSMGGADIGTYRVYASTHQIDQNGRYVCSFEAVPADLKYLPTPEVKIPAIHPIQVECWSNSDPLNIGRIKVKFPFDERPCDYWMPVMTPDAGGDPEGVVKVNRGSVWIPEVGDFSLAFFLNGSELSQPFILGSLFNGSNALDQGGGKGNHIKTITDKSGSYFMMNSREGSLEWHSYMTKNTITFDKEGVIHVTAPKKIILSSQDIEIQATNNLTFNAGNSVITNAVSGFYLFADIVKNTIKQTFTLFSGSTLLSSRNNINIESEKVNAIGTEKVFLHSDQLIHANSKGTMDLKSDGMLTQAQNALSAEASSIDEIALAIVQFRPLEDYDAEFGFDWLRIDERPSLSNSEKKYEEILENGWYDPNVGGVSGITKYEYLPDPTSNPPKTEREVTFEAFEKKYSHIPINKADTDTTVADRYYVPWLSLYTKQRSDSVADITSVADIPPYEAKLRVTVEIFKNLDQIKIEPENNGIFTITNDILDEKTVQDNQWASRQVTITCNPAKKEYENGFPDHQLINVWAYEKDLLQKSEAVQLRERKLCGRLKVHKNADKNRDRIKIVFVSVRLDIRSTRSSYGPVIGGETEYLKKFLYHALIYTASLDIIVEGLDLTGDSKFKILPPTATNPNSTYGAYIYENTSGARDRLDGGIYHTNGMMDYLKQRFLLDKPDHMAKYGGNDCCFVFSIDEESYKNHISVPATATSPAIDGQVTMGRARDFGTRNIVILQKRDATTLAHEVLHGLGLYHVFRDKDDNGNLRDITIQERAREFIFDPETTDNIMSYSAKKLTSLKWQWELMNQNLKK